MRFGFIIFILGFTVSFCNSSLAETIRLFTNSGKPVRDYASIAVSVQTGDVLLFSNGQKFTIKSALGSGFATLVFETTNGEVLRIPSAPEYAEMNQDYLEGYKQLKAMDVPTVEVFEKESLPQEYLLVEKIQFSFTLEDLINGDKKVSAQERENLFKKLLKFSERAAVFTEIGDFHVGQLVFDGEKWLLLDFSSNHLKAESARVRQTFFDGLTEAQVKNLDRTFGMNSWLALKNKIIARRKLGPILMCSKLF